MKDNEVLCTIKWTVTDVKKSLTEELNREPTEEEIQECIDAIGWDLIEADELVPSEKYDGHEITVDFAEEV